MGKILRPSGTWEMPSGTSRCASIFVISSPRKMTVPPALFSRPLTARRVVVLPAPFAPMRVTILPWGTSNETSLIASMHP